MPYLLLTLKLPDKLQPYGLYVYYVVHICDFGMLRVNVPLRPPSGICPRCVFSMKLYPIRGKNYYSLGQFSLFNRSSKGTNVKG